MKINIPSPAPRELVLVVSPDAKLRVRGDKIISIDKAADVTPLMDLVSAGHIAVRPLFGVSEEWLQQRTAHLDVKMGRGQPLDLSIFYKVTAADNRFEDFAGFLREMPFVQSAYIKPGVELTIIDNSIEFLDGIAPGPKTGDFTDRQVYLNKASEGGVGARCAWEKEGGRGRGVNIIDAEGAWRFSHEDLIENQCGLIGGVARFELGWSNHGTAVLGVISGDRNGFGVTGICPEATVRAVSVFGSSTGDPVLTWSAAAAIRLAADMLRRGDIILIEHHLPGPPNFEELSSQVGYIPVEWWPCNMAAIQYATARGIIVVEAAGNGQQNLDDRPLYNKNPDPPHGPFPPWWVNPFRRDPIDTGAILVGAGIPPKRVHGGDEELDRSRLEESNFGRVVDAQGWGDNVVTCGYGGLSENDQDEDRWYTSRFNGTSSAAAMVAGVVGCLQGALRSSGGLLDPARARNLLRDDTLNSPQTDGPFGTPASDFRVGPRPDLCKLLDHLIPHPDFMGRVKNLIKRLLDRSRP